MFKKNKIRLAHENPEYYKRRVVTFYFSSQKKEKVMRLIGDYVPMVHDNMLYGDGSFMTPDGEELDMTIIVPLSDAQIVTIITDPLMRMRRILGVDKVREFFGTVYVRTDKEVVKL